MTFVVPEGDRLKPQEIPLIAGLAVREIAAELSGRAEIRLKWPNDVVHAGRKIAGLLCERINRVDLIGIGLNVNPGPSKIPRDLRDRIEFLAELAGHEHDMTETLMRLATTLHAHLRRRAEQSFAAFVREYQSHDDLRGKRITVLTDPTTSVSGRCEGIDDSGRLVMRTTRGLERVVAGHILSDREPGNFQ